jgi:hypothetical protein
VLFALQAGLRSGEIWVHGSRRYANPATCLIPPADWPAQRDEVLARTRVPARFADRLDALDAEIDGYLDQLEPMVHAGDGPAAWTSADPGAQGLQPFAPAEE